MILSNARIAGARISGARSSHAQANQSDDLVTVRIVDGVIASIEPASSAGDSDAEGGEFVDLGGRWLSPGLWDNHVHFSQWALHSRRVDVSHATSAAETVQVIADAVRVSTLQPGEVVQGAGFRDGLWADSPLATLLDAVSGSQPVAIISGDLHAVWLNTAALELYGFSGHPTGLLREDEAFAVQGLMNTISDATLDRYVVEAAATAASRGVVGIVDMEMSYNLDAWTRRSQAGFSSLRVEYAVYPQHLNRAIAEGVRGGDRLSELISAGPFKVITDGSLNTRTAYCYDPYPGVSGDNNTGMLTVAPADLLDLMRTASASGFRPAVHAIGDHANSLALDAFAEIGCRGSIEHAQLLTARDIPRFAELGVIASVQPEHALDDRDVADLYWAGRTEGAFVLRALLDAGASLALGSDAPVAPLDPWVSMAAAVGRTRDGREPWHPEQRISPAEALAASVRSHVAPGEPADLVVTEFNPVDATAETLRTMPVAATLLGGRFTHNIL